MWNRRAALKPCSDWRDRRPETEINFKFHCHATNKIVGLTDETSTLHERFFWKLAGSHRPP